MDARRVRGTAGILALCIAVAAGEARAQYRDHWQCYKAKDPVTLQGLVQVTTRFGTDFGCRLGKAKLYCEPAQKTAVSSNKPLLPVVGRGLLDSRICYKLQCSGESAANFSGITDQFGPHRFLGSARGRFLCVPAVFGPPASAMDNLDDVKCYKATDPTFGLQASALLDTAHFGVASGCEVGRTKYFCTSAHTTILSLDTGTPLAIGPGSFADDDRTCYAERCNRKQIGPTVVSDRFRSRTDTGLVAKFLCAPAPSVGPTTTTTSTTVTTTTLPAGTDPKIVCQRTIEAGGMQYARVVLSELANCAAPGGFPSISSCFTNPPSSLSATYVQWRADAEAACAGVNLATDLGYGDRCGATPSDCAFVDTTPAGVTGCLACGIRGRLRDIATVLYADRDTNTSCQTALGGGALDLLRNTLEEMGGCVQMAGATSVAACYTPDPSAWRTQAESACTGVDPFGTLGYSHSCSRLASPVSPGACAGRAYACTMNTTALSTPNPDNDVLDCLGCQVGEGVLGVARDLFGANLCCVGGVCNKVLTRVACFQAGGTPAHYRMDSLPGVNTGGAHGIEIGPDNNLYMTGPGNVVTRVALPGNVQTTMGNTPFFPTGVTVDTAGNVYVTNRCGHTLTKIAPGGIATPFAGTGVAGHSGDGGPATAAQIDGPDGIAVDPAGNVYFTESAFLGISCGVFASATESIRMVDPSGIIHTVAGAGTGPVDGPALGAGFFVPYALRRALDGTLLIGEAGYQRALRIDASGTLRLLAGAQIGPIGVHSGYGGPAARAEFYQNCGIADDPDGNVVIAPMEDNRIALVDTLGSVIAIAGTGDGSTYGMPSGDGGPALAGQAGCPEDVDVGPDGTIYFSDLFTQRIRVLTRTGF
jgi:hypothetical protein